MWRLALCVGIPTQRGHRTGAQNMTDFTLSTVAAIPFDIVLLVGRAVFLVFCFAIAAIAFTRWRRTAETTSDRFMERTALLLERLSGLEQQIAATNARLDQLQEGLTSNLHRPAAASSSTANYTIAIRLARNGSRCEELIESCGLTRQEAELVLRLHAPRRTRAA
jgi:hypothetical protein